MNHLKENGSKRSAIYSVSEQPEGGTEQIRNNMETVNTRPTSGREGSTVLKARLRPSLGRSKPQGPDGNPHQDF